MNRLTVLVLGVTALACCEPAPLPCHDAQVTVYTRHGWADEQRRYPPVESAYFEEWFYTAAQAPPRGLTFRFAWGGQLPSCVIEDIPFDMRVPP